MRYGKGDMLGYNSLGPVSKIKYHMKVGLVETKSKHFSIFISEETILYTAQSKISIKLEHVKRHQNDECDYSKLPRMAQLNV